MDRNSGPFRSSRPAARPASTSAPQLQPAVEQSYRLAEDRPPARATEPVVTLPETKVRKTKGPKRHITLRIEVTLAIIIVAAFAACFGWQGCENMKTGINTSEYQAVALTNNEIYVGKLKRLNDQYMVLSDVFYLQSSTSSNSSDSTTLTKPSKGIYGSEDQMIIPRAQISFYENLQPSGKVAQAIAKYDAAN